MCIWAYLEPKNPEASDVIAACNQEYKVYSLLSGLSMMLPMLLIIYIMIKSWSHSNELTETLSYAALGLESLICIALFAYKINLMSTLRGVCDDTGTAIGSTVVAIIEGGSILGSLGAFSVITALLAILVILIGKRICCSSCGGKIVVGSSLVEIPYIEHYFTTCTDSCAICLSEF